jgi:myo-inositol-1(or 4)-monophosphatase
MKERKDNYQELMKIETLGKILQKAHRVCVSIGQEGEEIIKRGVGFGELGNDTEIKADKIIGQALIKSFEEYLQGIPFTIEVEGLGRFDKDLSEETKAKYYITVDPLDGSLNYRLKGETLGLPFSSVVAVFEDSDPQFQDCLMAGVIDLRNGDLWVAQRNKDCFVNGKRCTTSGKKEIDLRNGIIIGEFYYPENRELLVKIFEGEKGWLRNPGSAAYEMSLVASGQADAFICDRQKSYELGAVYCLVKEAGGYVCDFQGNDLAERVYEFNSQVPVVVAATKELANRIVNRIER